MRPAQEIGKRIDVGKPGDPLPILRQETAGLDIGPRHRLGERRVAVERRPQQIAEIHRRRRAQRIFPIDHRRDRIVALWKHQNVRRR